MNLGERSGRDVSILTYLDFETSNFPVILWLDGQEQNIDITRLPHRIGLKQENPKHSAPGSFFSHNCY